MADSGAASSSSVLGKRNAITPPAEEGEGEEESLTPLQREIMHGELEKAGDLTFPVFRNDGTDEALIALIQLKTIFTEQLPKMPKEYISRLVLDRQHVSLICSMKGEIVGGITYRPVKSQAFSEIVFCAVSAKHQVQGYGTRIMNQIKEECKRTGIEGMLTYADNHAVGYFRKQGFKKQVTMKRQRWQGYVKDYEGATLMECVVDPSIDFLTTRQLAETQRKALVARIAEIGAKAGEEEAPAASAPQQPARNFLKDGWPAPKFGITHRGTSYTLSDFFRALFDAVVKHVDAWPFQAAVSVAEAPDYYSVIKTPVDLSLIRRRLDQTSTPKPYYITPDQLLADLYLMCENCKTYNDPSTTYYETASRLENFVKAFAAEATITRLPDAE